MRRLGLAISRHAPNLFRELIGIGGAVLVAYGCWTLHPAAGYIVGGVLMTAGAWLHARMPE